MVDKLFGGLVEEYELRPSQFAQDLLAAFLLGAKVVMGVVSPESGRPSGPGPGVGSGLSGGVVSMDDGFGDGDMGGVTLREVMGMDPLRREAVLSVYGLKQSVVGDVEEYDPTVEEVRKLVEGEVEVGDE